MDKLEIVHALMKHVADVGLFARGWSSKGFVVVRKAGTGHRPVAYVEVADDSITIVDVVTADWLAYPAGHFDLTVQLADPDSIKAITARLEKLKKDAERS